MSKTKLRVPCVWTEQDVLSALEKGDFTVMELVAQSGGSFLLLQKLLAKMREGKQIQVITSRGARKLALMSRKKIKPNKRKAVRRDTLLNLIAKHQPVKLETLAELTGRGRFYIRQRITPLRESGAVKYDVLGESWRFALADYVRPADDIGREILLRCKKSGDDCLVWTGAQNGEGRPVMRHAGNTRRVDVVLWTAVHGKALKKGFALVQACETKGCCNHDHHERVTRSAAMKLAFDAIGFGGAAHGYAVSKAKRALPGALTTEQLALLRSSPKKAADMAKELGVTKSVITAARRNETYRDYSRTPFSGLGARS